MYHVERVGFTLHDSSTVSELLDRGRTALAGLSCASQSAIALLFRYLSAPIDALSINAILLSEMDYFEVTRQRRQPSYKTTRGRSWGMGIPESVRECAHWGA